MKIENHAIFMQTEHKTSQVSTKEFLMELNTSFLKGAENPQELVLDDSLSIISRLRLIMLYKLLSMLGLDYNKLQAESSADMASNLDRGPRANPLLVRSSPMMEVTCKETLETSEKLDAKIQGFVKTEDGREIKLKADLKMSQTFSEKFEKTEMIFTDPLVVNFSGALPELEEACFAFDIDNDGKSDQISKLSKGSGFLALDKNGNCEIDDGCELFGTRSGDGFAELFAYDSDKNNWIDANDPVLDKLRIWVEDGEKSKLMALGEVGIGAIYLGSADADFSYKTANGESLGNLRSTGMFLYENGNIGNISQIDFAKQQPLVNESENLKNALQSV